MVRYFFVIALVFCEILLIVLTVISSQLTFPLQQEFEAIVDVTSKVATVGVFFWAVYTYNEQEKIKSKDDKLRMTRDLGGRIIDFVSSSKFVLSYSNANVLIALLKAVREENNTDDPRIVREIALSLIVARETVKNASLTDISGLNFDGDYQDIIDKLIELYKSDELKDFDHYYYEKINTYEKSTCIKLNPPSNCIRIGQIRKIMELLYSLTA